MEAAPCFIKNRGCINCWVSQKHKERTGKPYGLGHELMFTCLQHPYKFCLYEPFYDPEEVLKLTEKLFKQGKIDKKGVENAVKYCRMVKAEFGKFYEKLGVDLDIIISEIQDIPNRKS